MKCLVVDGSGHLGGYTDTVCGVFSQTAKSKGWDCTVLRLGDFPLLHCTGCGACVNSRTCVLEDDLTSIYRNLDDYDFLVLASPIRFSGLSSQMKLFIDRMNPFWHHSQPVPKWMGIMLVAGSPGAKFSNAESIMKSLAKGTGMKWMGAFEIDNTDNISKDECSKKTAVFADSVLLQH